MVALSVINLHGQLIPVLDIRRRFALSSCDSSPTTHRPLTRVIGGLLVSLGDEVVGVGGF